MSRIAVLGAGAWGTALAISLARRGGHELVLWAHSPAHAAELAETGENLRYLPGFILPADVQITSQLDEAVSRPEHASALRPWAILWERAVANTFLRGYRETMRDHPLLPTADSAQALLVALLLEKAFYELQYELNNRPAWLHIPLTGLLDLMNLGA